MDDVNIPLSQINADFTEDTEPKDEHLIELLGKAYREEIDCQLAIVPMTLIKPFSDFTPVITEVFREKFVKDYKAGEPWQLYVYRKDDAYIMSDDYTSYFLYKEFDCPEAMCLIIDPTPNEAITFIGEPFKLPLPTAEIIGPS